MYTKSQLCEKLKEKNILIKNLIILLDDLIKRTKNKNIKFELTIIKEVLEEKREDDKRSK